MVTLPGESPPNWIVPTYLSPVPADPDPVTVSAVLLL